MQDSSTEPFTRRTPWLWWVISLVTLGIGFLVWYYNVNRELAEANPRRHVSPGMAVVAVTLGSFLIIPPFVSIYNTGIRIRRAQRDAGLPASSSGGVSLLLCFILILNVPYQQIQLNLIADASDEF